MTKRTTRITTTTTRKQQTQKQKQTEKQQDETAKFHNPNSDGNVSQPKFLWIKIVG